VPVLPDSVRTTTPEKGRDPLFTGAWAVFFSWTADWDGGCREPDIMQSFNNNPSPGNGVVTPYGK
jgi:hypothetical protein